MIPVSGWVIFITELWEDLQENMSRPVFSLQISSPTYFLKGFFWTMMIENLVLCIIVFWKVLKEKVVSIQTLDAWKTHLKFVKPWYVLRDDTNCPPPDLEITVISSAGTLQLNYCIIVYSSHVFNRLLSRQGLPSTRYWDLLEKSKSKSCLNNTE